MKRKEEAGRKSKLTIPHLRESLKVMMEREAERLGITLDEACERAFVSFLERG